MRLHPTYIHALLISIIILSFIFRLSAQNNSLISLSGTVKDEAGIPVPYALVLIDTLQLKTMTDIDGNFKINNTPSGSYLVTVKCIGFKVWKQEVEISNQPISVKLQENVQQLNDAVIETETKVDQVREQSYAVNVIDTKVLANQSKDLNQVLSTSPGVRIREEGGLGSSFDFSLNGFNGNQVRFFIDGIPMENFGSSLTLNNIPVNVADRIEIYKGVVPVTLGSDALGGAVNIVTKQTSHNYLDVSYSYGSFNTHRSALNGGYTHKKTGLTFRASLFQNYSDNSYKVKVNDRDGSVILKDMVEQRRFHDAYDSKTAMINVGVVDKKYADQLFLGFVGSGNEKEIQTGSTMERVYGQRKLISSTLMPTLRYKKSDFLTKGLELNGFASYNFGASQIIDTASRNYFWDGSHVEKADSDDGELNKTMYKFSDNSLTIRSNLSYVLSDHHSFVINYTRSSLNRKGTDPVNPINTANNEPKILSKTVLGIGYKYDLGKRLSASVFGKNYFLNGLTHYTINHYTTNDRVARSLKNNFVGYGMAVSYRFVPKTIQLKASFEKAYRMPEGNELFGDGANVKGNAELRPEESNNYNLGVLYEVKINKNHGMNVEANLLYRDIQSFIRAAVSDPVSAYVNEDAVEARGVEGSLRYAFQDRFKFSQNITYQILKNNDPLNADGKENITYGSQIPNIPYFFANTNASIHFGNVFKKDDHFSVGYEFNFVEEYYLKWAIYGNSSNKLTIPRQFTHDVSFNYSFKDGTYNISVACRNILDADLYDNFKLQKPGRNFTIKLRYFIQN